MAPSIRLLVAVLLAPVATCVLLLTGLMWLSGCVGFGCQLGTIGSTALIGAMVGVYVGIPASVIGGLPAHVFLMRTQRTHAGFYALSGALIGLVATLVTLLFMGPRASFGGWEMAFGLGVVAGVLSALLFWSIRRPDRDAANPATRAP